MFFNRYLRRHQGIADSLLMITSSLIASAFSAVAIILISRLLGPISFAYFSSAFSLSLILNRLQDSGLNIALQKLVGGTRKKKKINIFLSLCLKYRLALVLLITALGLIFSAQISALLNIDNPALIPLTFLVSVSTTFFESSLATLQSLGNNKLAAFSYFFPSLFKLLLAIFVYWQGITDINFIISLYLLAALPSLLLFHLFKPRWLNYDLKIKKSKAEIKLKAILRHSALSVIVAGLIENLDILFAKHYLTDFETGLLAGVSRIAMLLYVVAYAMANVLNPRVAAYKKAQDLKIFIGKAWLIFALSVLAFALSLPFAPYLIRFTIGSDYLSALNVLHILLGAGFISVALMPFISPFYAFKNNRYFSLSAVLQLIIILLGNMIFVPQHGIIASAWVRLIARAGLLLFTWLMLKIEWRREFKS